ncbi:MAG: hypothetical protein R3337_00155 [Gammaproteobacteria bacterium]|nr:hypothetical protein [Gammaproteobacteria bacterium]
MELSDDINVEIFDSLTGGTDGSAARDGWSQWTLAEALEQAEAMHEHYFPDTPACDYEAVARAVVAAQEFESSNEWEHLRDSLRDPENRYYGQQL